MASCAAASRAPQTLGSNSGLPSGRPTTISMRFGLTVRRGRRIGVDILDLLIGHFAIAQQLHRIAPDGDDEVGVARAVVVHVRGEIGEPDGHIGVDREAGDSDILGEGRAA